MRKKLETELKVGLFVSVGLGLIMLAILVLGGPQGVFGKSNRFSAHFKGVEGLITGAKVVLSGVTVGSVETIEFDKEKRDIRVTFLVNKESMDWIRTDSTAEIATQGMLGDKYISISAGSPEEPILPSGSDIPNRPGKDLTQFISKGDQLMVTLNGMATSVDRILKSFEHDNRSETFFKGMALTAKNLSVTTEKMKDEMNELQLKRAVGQLNQILEKINNGTGTLGALINDPSLYDEVRALMGGANRNRIIRNLVRQTIKDSEEKSKATPTPTSSK